MLSRPMKTQALAGMTLAVALICGTAPGLAQGANPFAGMSGAWAGSGKIDLSDGSSERIRCRATYTVGEGGGSLQQELRCASDSYKFEVNSAVKADAAGAISGSWTETTRNITGRVSGKVSGGQIQTRVDGAAFTAKLTVNTTGTSQAVTIVPTGTDVKGVAVTLTKAK
jgi:hypothetical protein